MIVCYNPEIDAFQTFAPVPYQPGSATDWLGRIYEHLFYTDEPLTTHSVWMIPGTFDA